MVVPVVGVLAHIVGPGYGPLIAMALFFVGMGAAVGVFLISGHPRTAMQRATRIGLVVVATGCLGFATAVPFIYHPGPSFVRPASTAHLEIVSPRPGQTLRGDPATVQVILRLDGGRIVPLTSTAVVPNEGHIHVFLDGRLLSMTGLDAEIIALPGEHTLRVEFVASDHAPFRPLVTASVTFLIRP
ncbi:MAG: hypothetical protein ACXVEI_02725 [Actinomycetota bacterium]